MPTIQVNDLEMYYERRGAGEPLTLIPGLGMDISEWEGVIAALAQRYSVLAFDNRGAGRTAKPNQPYTLELMADDTAGLLAALGIERTHVVGVSMGGRIALALALNHPGQVERLVLVSTSARSHRRPWWFGLAGLLSTSPLFRSKYPQPRYAYLRQRAASFHLNFTPRLHEIRAPTLILHGKRDKLIPIALAEEMQAQIPNARLEVFAGGHLFLLFAERQPALAAISAFLGE